MAQDSNKMLVKATSFLLKSNLVIPLLIKIIIEHVLLWVPQRSGISDMGYDTQAGILMFEETVHVNLTGYWKFSCLYFR